MSNKALRDAQAYLKEFEKQSQPEAEQAVIQTEEVVDSANQQQESIPVVNVEADEAVAVPQEVVNQPPPSDSRIDALTAELEKLTNSFKSLQGKYNKELPEARNDVARLLAENNLLKEQLMNKQASQVEIPAVAEIGLKERLGQEKVDELGENYVNAIDEATEFKIKQALAKQEAEFAQRQEALQEQIMKDKFERYENTVVAKVNNFIQLVDPYGDGKLDSEFCQYLVEHHMFEAFDNADRNMNSDVVIDICNIYNNSKVPVAPVVTETPVVPAYNPKAQAIAPKTTNTSTPQLQPTTPKYAFKLSDYITKGNAFASGKIKASEWIVFEKNYNQAVAEGKVDLTA